MKQVLQPKKTTYAEENSDEITMRHASVQYCNDLQENRRHNFDNRHDISYRTEQDRFEQNFVDYDVAMDIFKQHEVSHLEPLFEGWMDEALQFDLDQLLDTSTTCRRNSDEITVRYAPVSSGNATYMFDNFDLGC